MDVNLVTFGVNPLVIMGPGVSEMFLTRSYGAYYLQCPGCDAHVAAPTEGIALMPMPHDGGCQWIDSVEARMKARRM